MTAPYNRIQLITRRIEILLSLLIFVPILFWVKEECALWITICGGVLFWACLNKCFHWNIETVISLYLESAEQKRRERRWEEYCHKVELGEAGLDVSDYTDFNESA